MDRQGLAPPRGESNEQLAAWAAANGGVWADAESGIEELAFLLGDDEW